MNRSARFAISSLVTLLTSFVVACSGPPPGTSSSTEQAESTAASTPICLIPEDHPGAGRGPGWALYDQAIRSAQISYWRNFPVHVFSVSPTGWTITVTDSSNGTLHYEGVLDGDTAGTPAGTITADLTGDADTGAGLVGTVRIVANGAPDTVVRIVAGNRCRGL